MTLSIPAAEGSVLHSQINQFYAEQMQLLDKGDTDAWAATFTQDGVFAANGLPQPAHGRAAIAEGARRSVEQLAAAGVVHRHWLGMLNLRGEPDGTVHVRCYALVIQIPRGGEPTIFRSTVCTDVLVPHGASWLVRERHVTRDDLP